MVKRSQSKHIEEDLTNGNSYTWLNVDEAALRVNKTPRFIRRLVAERRLRYFKHGGFVAIRKTDLDQWAMSEPREPLR
jgi:excisionase family DNA binding protein